MWVLNKEGIHVKGRLSLLCNQYPRYFPKIRIHMFPPLRQSVENLRNSVNVSLTLSSGIYFQLRATSTRHPVALFERKSYEPSRFISTAPLLRNSPSTWQFLLCTLRFSKLNCPPFSSLSFLPALVSPPARKLAPLLYEVLFIVERSFDRGISFSTVHRVLLSGRASIN